MLSWYALHVRHQCEQLVEASLEGYCETWWPHRSIKVLSRVIRRPWFPGYLFVRLDWDQPDDRMRVQQTPWVINIVGNPLQGPAVIPDQEIESLQRLSQSRASVTLHPYIELGDRVRVTRGPLAGVEGLLMRFQGTGGLLIVQIELLGRAVATQLSGEMVEACASIKKRKPQAA